MEKEEYMKLTPVGRDIFKRKLLDQKAGVEAKAKQALENRLVIIKKIKKMEDDLKQFKKDSQKDLYIQLNIATENDKVAHQVGRELVRIGTWDEELAVIHVRLTKALGEK
jgi:hypothetical protein